MDKQDFIFDSEYGYNFNSMCENFYARIDLILNGLMLVGGSAAVVGALSAGATSTGVAGVAGAASSGIAGAALAACSAIALLVKPAEKAIYHRQAKCDYLKLKSCCPDVVSKKLEHELTEIQARAPNGFGWLEVPAFNRTLNTLGYESGQRPISFFTKLMSAFVH